ncbi:MAG: ABC transporter ATP-binding protein [Ignavibacteriae bacterium]|nr:ABC transporter ATP-binding protein [Ignavibacteriota bacterium]
MSFIKIQNLSKEYHVTKENVIAINNITENISENEFVTVMGPSGSGKSTFLTTVGGLSQPTTGSVIIDDINIFELDSDRLANYRREYIGFVFQSFHLLKYLTVQENVMLPLVVCDLNKKDKMEMSHAILEKVGLKNKVGRMIDELSGGEQQRVAIARALVNEPLILLADEPTGNLDSKTGESIMELFCELNEEGKCVIVVTHDEKIQSYAKRSIYFLDGKIIN